MSTYFVGLNVNVIYRVVLELARQVVLQRARGWTEEEVLREVDALLMREVMSAKASAANAPPTSTPALPDPLPSEVMREA